jgi:hypothetical protein
MTTATQPELWIRELEANKHVSILNNAEEVDWWPCDECGWQDDPDDNHERDVDETDLDYLERELYEGAYFDDPGMPFQPLPPGEGV